MLEDEVGLQLVDPDDGWRDRPDMDPAGTAASGRPSWPELVSSRTWWPSRPADGVAQYVLLGAGLDTFAQRRPELASRLRVFEVDQPGPQAWKRRRLIELGFGLPDWLRLVPVDFEATESWWHAARRRGLRSRPARGRRLHRRQPCT